MSESDKSSPPPPAAAPSAPLPKGANVAAQQSLSDRIARLNISNASGPSVNPSGISPSGRIPSNQNPGQFKDKIKRFQNNADAEAPLVPKGSFGLGAPASKVVPGGLGSGFAGANIDRNRITTLGAGGTQHHYNPNMGPRSVSTSAAAEGIDGRSDGGGSRRGLSAGQRATSRSSSRSREPSIGPGEDASSDISVSLQGSRPATPATVSTAATTPQSPAPGDNTNLLRASLGLGRAGGPGAYTPSVSSVNVEAGSVTSDVSRENYTAPPTPSASSTPLLDGGHSDYNNRKDSGDDDESERAKAELTRQTLEAYEAEPSDIPAPPTIVTAAESFSSINAPETPQGRSATLASPAPVNAELPTPKRNAVRDDELDVADSSIQEFPEQVNGDGGGDAGSDGGGSFYDDYLDDLTGDGEEEQVVPPSIGDDGMPRVKCSDCGKEVDMMALADHICTPGSPSPSTLPPPSSPPNLKSTKSNGSSSSYNASRPVPERFDSRSRNVPDVPMDDYGDDLRTDSFGAPAGAKLRTTGPLDFTSQSDSMVPEDVVEDLDDLHPDGGGFRGSRPSISSDDGNDNNRNSFPLDAYDVPEDADDVSVSPPIRSTSLQQTQAAAVAATTNTNNPPARNTSVRNIRAEGFSSNRSSSRFSTRSPYSDYD